MASSVEDLYRQYAGREADPGGLQYWQQQFGSAIDPNEVSAFQNAIAEARAQGTEPMPTAQSTSSPAPLYTSLSAQSTPDQIAAAYKEYTGMAGGNTQAAQGAAVNYLQNLGISAPTIESAYKIYLGAPAAATGALSQATNQTSADPIENLYRQYAGRSSDPSGLEYWRNQFGSEVDPTEAATFQRAIAENASKGIETSATGTSFNSYFEANPDVAAEYLRNTQGMTPDQFAATHYVKFGASEGRNAPEGFSIPAIDVLNGGLGKIDMSNINLPDLTNFSQTWGNYLKSTDPAAYRDWSLQNLTSQISGSQVGDQYWTGYGYGDKSDNATAIATWLSQNGITDLNQLGVKKVDVTRPVDVISKQLDGKQVVSVASDYGRTNYYAKDPDTGEYREITKADYDRATPLYGVFDWEGGATPVSNQSKVQIINGVPTEVLSRPDFYNKETGKSLFDIPYGGKDIHYVADEALPSDFSEVVPGQVYNIGRTFAGEGGTNYNVVFDEKGNPNFFTSWSGPTSDLGTLSDIATFASFIPGPWQIPAQLVNAGIAIDQGNEVGAILNLIGAGTNYYGGELAGMTTPGSSTAVSGLDLASDVATLGSNPALQTQNILSNLNTARTGTQIYAAIQGKDPSALLTSLATTAAGQAVANTPVGDSGVTVGEVVKGAQVLDALNRGELGQAVTLAGDVAKSSDLRVAGLGASIFQELNSDTPNMNKILGYATQLQSTVKSAGERALTIPKGDLGERIYDDTIVQAGADAFVAAKDAGASDEDAMAAADAVTGSTTRTVDSSSATNKVDLPQEDVISERTRLGQEYADSLGKKIEDLTTEEIDRFVSNVDSAIASNGSAVLKGASIQDILSGNYATGRVDDRGFYYEAGSDVPRLEIVGGTKVDSEGDPVTESATSIGSQVATNVADAIVENVGGLEGTTGDVVKQGLSTLLSAIGEQVADLSTSLGNMGLISRDNAGVTAGKYLEDIGKRLELPETRDAVNNWVRGVSEAPTYFGKLSAGVKGVIQNPLVLTEVGKEIIQEALPIGLAAKVVKFAGIGAGVATDTLLNALESAGSTGRQKYEEEISKGTPPAEAARIADRSAGYAGLITMATSGIVDSAIAKKYGDAIENYLGRKASSTGKEFGQESFEEGMIALATGDSLPEALTKSVIGGVVGGKTSGTIQTAADVQADLASSFAEQGLASTDGSFRPDTIVPIESMPGLAADAGDVVSDVADATSVSSISSNVSTQIGSGVDASTAVGSAVTSAVDAGADVNSSVAAAVSSAINAGADVSVVVDAATNAAAATGNTVSITSDANTVTINNATTNINTTVDIKTGVTTTVDLNNNTTTSVDGNTTTTVDSNTNTNTQTTVDTANNTVTSTTVDLNTNTTTQTTIDSNTQTTVVTDTNTDTQTTVKVNIDTGEVIEEKETEIPSDWTQPKIEISGTPATQPGTKKPEAKAKASKPKLAGTAGLAGGMGAMLPSGFDMDPALLPSRETQKAIDPLQRVMEAQAELEKTAMMQQIDPRLLNVLQQRIAPEQQVNQQQQFDRDIGALSRLLSGQPEPSNENSFYSYGSEDSIDDILGGKAANYAAGGYVEPLKASGGSMALPLLAKSGGALGQYGGRENFKDGKHVAGEGDGQSDDIPAWLADGEYVLDAELVSALGNGSTKAGVELLDEFRKQIRAHKRGGSLNTIPPKSKSPLSYLRLAEKSLKKK